MRAKILSFLAVLAVQALFLFSATADDTLFYATTYNAYSSEPPGSIVKVTAAGVVSLWDVRDSGGDSIVFEDPEGIAVDVLGNVYVNDGLYVYKINPSGVGGVFITKANFYDANGLTLDGAGNIYAQGNVDFYSTIFKYDSSGAAGTPASWEAIAFDITIGPDGYLYTADPFNQVILRYSTAGVFDSGFAVPVTGLSSMTFAPNGDIFASASFYDEGTDGWLNQIFKVTFNEEGVATVSLYSDTGLDDVVFRGMAMDSLGNLYTAAETCGCEGAENVIFITGTNGVTEIFAEGTEFQRFNDIAMIPEPSTYMLLGLGLATVLVVRRKHKRKRSA